MHFGQKIKNRLVITKKHLLSSGLIFVFVGTIIVSFNVTNAQSATLSPSELLQRSHTVEIRSNRYPTKCVDVQYGNTANQTPVQTYDCLNNANQRFTIVPVSSSVVSIRFNGKCVDVMWGQSANGTKVWLWDCTGDGAQLWQPLNGGVFRNILTGKCLDSEYAPNGFQIKIWDCNGLDFQSWTVTDLNPPPPTPTPTRTPTPTPTNIPPPTPIVTTTPTPPVSTGTIISNLNFGINNTKSWIQTVCGDIRIDNGITNPMPSGNTTIITNASCPNAGLVYTGDATADFGSGQASSSNQIVGGANYPEVYTSSGTNNIGTSYTSLSQKVQRGGITPVDLASICTLSNCTLPVNLTHGVYLANDNVVLNAYTFPSNQDYVFLINGTLTLNGNIITPQNSNSTALFSSTGNIIVLPTVGNPPPSTVPNVSGIFSTDKSFIVQGNNDCNDLKFNFEGTLIVNASRGGGTLQNLRNFCVNNQTSPSITFTQRLDFLFSLPEFLKVQKIISEEAAP